MTKGILLNLEMIVKVKFWSPLNPPCRVLKENRKIGSGGGTRFQAIPNPLQSRSPVFFKNLLNPLERFKEVCREGVREIFSVGNSKDCFK
jgi:hypothetical protein